MSAEVDLIAESEKATQGKVVGIIIPPPDIRAVADKTAQFVAKNGKTFEERILRSAQGHKFDFMRKNDVYYAYYEHKIREFEEGTAEENERKRREAEERKRAEEEKRLKEQRELEEKQQKQTLERSKVIVSPIVTALKKVPEDEAPPPLDFILPEMAALSVADLDVIKLCAQFTALGGRQFLAELQSREERNAQFDFLRPTSMLFAFFSALVDAYSKLVNQPDGVKKDLRRSLDSTRVIERAVWRWKHERASEAARQAKEEAEVAERMAFTSIDWHDFTIVETIDFGKDELLETPAEGTAQEEQDGVEADEDVDMEDDEDMDMDMEDDDDEDDDDDNDDEDDDDEDMQDAAEEGIKVVADYKPQVKTVTADAPKLVVDPVSGKAVPIDEVSEHMRIQLIDPKYRTETLRAQQRQSETNIAAGSSIADNLKSFANRRVDIFGSTEEEELALLKDARDAQKNAEERQAIIWEGRNAKADTDGTQDKTGTAATDAAPPTSAGPPRSPAGFGSLAPPAAAPRVIATALPAPVHTAPGSARRPTGDAQAPAGPARAAAGDVQKAAGPEMGPPPGIDKRAAPEDAEAPAPEVKRAKLATALMSVDEFLRKYPAEYSISVLVPENAAWNLQENVHSINVSAQGLVKSVKEQLSNMIGIPGNKFQLKFNHTGKFLRDSESLAVANVTPKSSVTLVIKGRGGRR